MYTALLIMSALALISTICGGLRGGFFLYSTSLINRRMRDDLFSSITKQEIAFFDSAQTGLFLLFNYYNNSF